jgi:hypothetical protein
MKYIGFEREDEAEVWVRERLDLAQRPSFFRAMSAVGADDQFVMAVVLTNFSTYNVDINIAMESGKITPKELKVMFNDVFGFLFEKLHMRRATGLTNESNLKARKSIEQFGFTLEGVMREAAPDGTDLMIYGFLAEEYRNHAWRRS